MVDHQGPLQTSIDFTIATLCESPMWMSTKPLKIANDRRQQQSPSTKPARYDSNHQEEQEILSHKDHLVPPITISQLAMH